MKPLIPLKGIRTSSFTILLFLLQAVFAFSLPGRGPALPVMNNFNTAPVAVDDHAHVVTNGILTASFIHNDYDPDGDSLSMNGMTINTALPGMMIQRVNTLQGGDIVFFTDGSYTYTPPPNFYGNDQVNYEICDVTGSPLCSTATIHIEVKLNGTVLAVHISSFSGRRTDKDILLQWTTLTEENCDHFEIQHSTDNSSFVVISSVKAKGNSNIPSAYSYLHKNITAAVSFYRINLVKKDGHSIYSKVIAIKDGDQTMVLNTIYPVPFRDKLELTITTEKAGSINVNIYDMNGKLVLTRVVQSNSGLNTITLNGLSSLQAGNYFIDISNAGNILQAKLYKAQ